MEFWWLLHFLNNMNKLAEQIIEEDKNKQSYRSIKLGFCKSLSENGLSPKEAENLLKKIAVDPVELARQYTLILTGAGAAAGIGSAMLRRKVEKSINETETQDMRATKSKIDAYKKMIRNFRDEKNLNNQQEELDSVGLI